MSSTTAPTTDTLADLVAQAKDFKRRMGAYLEGRNESRLDLSEKDLLVARAKFAGEQHARERLPELKRQRDEAAAENQRAARVCIEIDEQVRLLHEERSAVESAAARGEERAQARADWVRRTAPVFQARDAARAEHKRTRAELQAIRQRMTALGCSNPKSACVDVAAAARTLGARWQEAVTRELA